MSTVVSLVLVALVSGLVVMGVGYAVVQTRALPFDRRHRLDRGRLDLPLSSGSCAVAMPVTGRLDASAAAGVAAAALDRIGVRDVVVLDPWTTAGWTGTTWRSYGQQVGVAIAPAGPDVVTLWCCSRPLIASTQLDFGASRRTAGQLADAVAALVPAQAVAAAPLG